MEGFIVKDLGERPCSQRPGKMRHAFAVSSTEESKIWTRPHDPDAPDLVAPLLREGFEKDIPEAIFPSCTACNGCVPLRIRMHGYEFSSNERRLMKNNADLAVTYGPPVMTDEHFVLFKKYMAERHPENDPHQWTWPRFDVTMKRHGLMQEIRSRRDDKLVCVSIMDRPENGISGFYTFYDTAFSTNKRSLGIFSDLDIIKYGQENGKDYFFLGMWVDGSRKMAHKTRFHNLETRTQSGWEPFDPAIHTTGPDFKKLLPPNTVWDTATPKPRL